MKVAVFSTKPYDREFFLEANQEVGHELVFFEARLGPETVSLARGFPAVCAFVTDQLDAKVLLELSANGTHYVALRSAGFNNIDLQAAESLHMSVARVPAYSPQAVAEHTVGLILTLARKIHRAYIRVRDGNLSLQGLLGMELNGRAVGVIGTGRIGTRVAQILSGFGCCILATDKVRNPTMEQLALYVPKEELCARSDIITLHCPLTPESFHLIDEEAIGRMKRGVMLINTSRGQLVDTPAVIRGLKSGKIGSLGLDVYEEEGDLFFEDLSDQVIKDDVFSRILTLPNVVVTGHQAFFTDQAMRAIARETLANISAFEQGVEPPGLIASAQVLVA